LYISNHCPAGCTYCGFASDRPQKRTKLNREAILTELTAMKRRGIDDVLLLTGDRTKEADVDFIAEAVDLVASHMNSVSCEVFAMRTKEYARLVDAGCVGLTMYHETYHPETYATVHPWGEKRNYGFRLEAPERALEAGMRFVGIGCLLGLTDPFYDVMATFRHALHLRRTHWKAGVMISFPRICEQEGDFVPRHVVDDRLLAQIVFAFRICLPDVPLVLSTREREAFRDGMAGLGISRMSVASRTTVGGYEEDRDSEPKQFETSDRREVEEFCTSLRGRGLEPVFKNWDSVLSKVTERI
jgi:2-iminoacetate synthase